MDKQKKDAICAAYLDKTIKTKDIEKQFKITTRQLTAILGEAGIPLRRPKKLKDGVKQCPKCHKKVDIKGARYCCFCGADMRTERERTILTAESLYGVCEFLPVNMRDETQNKIKEIVAFLNTVKE